MPSICASRACAASLDPVRSQIMLRARLNRSACPASDSRTRPVRPAGTRTRGKNTSVREKHIGPGRTHPAERNSHSLLHQSHRRLRPRRGTAAEPAGRVPEMGAEGRGSGDHGIADGLDLRRAERCRRGMAGRLGHRPGPGAGHRNRVRAILAVAAGGRRLLPAGAPRGDGPERGAQRARADAEHLSHGAAAAEPAYAGPEPALLRRRLRRAHRPEAAADRPRHGRCHHRGHQRLRPERRRDPRCRRPGRRDEPLAGADPGRVARRRRAADPLLHAARAQPRQGPRRAPAPSSPGRSSTR